MTVVNGVATKVELQKNPQSNLRVFVFNKTLAHLALGAEVR